MQKIKIYGERHTGSNYLSRLVAINLIVEELPGTAPRFIRKVESLLGMRHHLRDLYFKRTFAKNLGWKHTRVPPLDVFMDDTAFATGNVAIVTLTKNPYSWLLSMHRSPYHMQTDGKDTHDLSFEAFLRRPWPTLGRDNAPDVANPVQLWNIKNAALLALPDTAALHLSTEETIVSPASVIDQITQRFDIPRRGETFVNFEASTKNRPGQDGDFYRDYYTAERWRGDLSADAIDWINEQVDQTLMQRLGYAVI